MKYILEIIATLHIGGAEKVARDIGLFLDQDKYKVHYIVFGDNIGEYEEELKKHGCEIFHMDSPGRNYLNYLKNLRELITKYRYHAVHSHTMFSSGWAMMIAKKYNVPVRITHAHSALILGNEKSLKRSIYESLMRLMINSYATDLIGCGVAAGERLYGRKVFKEKGKLILNGIDIQRYIYNQSSRNLIRSQYNLQDAFVVGHVGHLAEVKNQRFLIEIMPQILMENHNAKLLLVGDGNDRSMLEELAKKVGVSDKVIFTGNVNNVQDYLSAMDVFAFPSLFEGLPLTLLEVQANGLPSVISDKIPKDVYLSDLIHPLPLNDKESWINNICSLSRNNKTEYSRILIENKFDILDSMKAIAELYEKE